VCCSPPGGGIAPDFNNLLVVILGLVELLASLLHITLAFDPFYTTKSLEDEPAVILQKPSFPRLLLTEVRKTLDRSPVRSND
jgi:hypothetical protein